MAFRLMMRWVRAGQVVSAMIAVHMFMLSCPVFQCLQALQARRQHPCPLTSPRKSPFKERLIYVSL